MTVGAFCIDCLKFRPVIDLDGNPGCVVCEARKRRQAAVNAQIREADQEQARRYRQGALKRAAAMKAKGSYRPGRPTTVVVPRQPQNAG
jgi:hypothetical protein